MAFLRGNPHVCILPTANQDARLVTGLAAYPPAFRAPARDVPLQFALATLREKKLINGIENIRKERQEAEEKFRREFNVFVEKWKRNWQKNKTKAALLDELKPGQTLESEFPRLLHYLRLLLGEFDV